MNAGPRPLSVREHRALGTLTAGLDCTRVRIYDSGCVGFAEVARRLVLALSGDRAVALGDHVFLPTRRERDVALLAHELTHCAQFQRWGAVRYFALGASTQWRDLCFRTLGIGKSPYRYSPQPGRTFDDYGMEQQGQIVEDCFRGDSAAAAISPYRPPLHPPR